MSESSGANWTIEFFDCESTDLLHRLHDASYCLIPEAGDTVMVKDVIYKVVGRAWNLNRCRVAVGLIAAQEEEITETRSTELYS